MTITVELPRDLAERFTAEAGDRGVPLGDLVTEVLLRYAAPGRTPDGPTAEDADRWFEQASDMLPAGIPPLSEAAISRDSIYSREDDWNR